MVRLFWQKKQIAMKNRVILVASWLVCGSASVRGAEVEPAVDGGAPQVVAVGKGSYASFPPLEVAAKSRETLARTLYVMDGKRPIPTNSWWADLVVEKYAGQLWAYPHQVKANERGIDFTFPTRWNDRGTDPVSEFPISVRGVDFKPTASRAKTWSDWLLAFRMAETPDKYFDVTLGRGLPYAWIEFHGVKPQLVAGKDAKFFDLAGKTVSLPMTGNAFGMESGGRSYGIFAPSGTRLESNGETIDVTFAGAKTYLVLCPLPARGDLAKFASFSDAIPRDSKMSWTYDPQKAQVETRWHLTTELLQGREHRLIQGWLPHHWRDTTNDLKFDGLQYLTPRGTMKCAVGTDFKITYPFNGLPPMPPAPQKTGLPNDYDEARMHEYLKGYAALTDYGNDTYWGGKRLTQFAQYMTIARQMNDPSANKLQSSLKTALVDWFTYTPGEKSHFFARYPRWKALVGFDVSYGSEAFNDHHFHYGYFTSSAAMLGLADPQFLRDYGGMARLVAKEYANWERDDAEFPFLRTFDIWEGHSWAGGFSSGGGNNQESSSEAMQSWSGVFLLGTALGDKAMAATGAMGYAIESHAVMEYWFDIHGDNFAPNFGHPVTGMVWSGGNAYGTYFSGDPAWIWGIQWLPMSPALSYLIQDPAFAKKSFGEMWDARLKKEGDMTIAKLGTALGNVILGQASQANPDWTAQQLDELWAANSPVAHDNDTPGLTYYFTHANRTWGAIEWDRHLSLPLSRVYFNARTKTRTYVAFNPSAQPQTAQVYKGAKLVGTLRVPPHQMISATRLETVSAKDKK